MAGVFLVSDQIYKKGIKKDVMKTVMVIMSTYNGEKFIQEQIDSILNQINCCTKIYVRDDGSTDRTVEILDGYKQRGLIDYCVGENLKPAKSFLTALLDCEQADYYAFSDQDDIWEKDKLYSAICMLEKMPDKKSPMLYCSNLKVINSNKIVLKEKLLPDEIVMDYEQLLVRSPHIFGCTEVFNNELYNIIKKNGVPKNLIMHDLWVALIAASCGNIIYDNDAHIKYRQHENNHTGATETPLKVWKNRMQVVRHKLPWSIADQAAEFIEYIGNDTLRKNGKLRYTQMVSDYKKSLKKMFVYIKNFKHDSMNEKQYAFHVLMIFMKRL